MKNLAAVFLVATLAGCTATPAVRQQPVSGATDNKPSFAEICERLACQHNVRVIVRRKNNKTYDKTFDLLPPIVQPMGITVVAGQTVNVEANVSGDTLINLKAVDTVTHPEKTITAKFKQVDGVGMILSIHNPFKRLLKFHMAIMPIDGEDFFKTSSCPVIAGGGSAETWPTPLFQVLLTDPKLLKDASHMACIY